jgi:hypothetical protein
MLKKLITSVLIMLLCSVFAIAQDDQLDDLSFETFDYQETAPIYFVAGGGFTGSFIFLNFNAINEAVPGINMDNSNIFMMGAEGFTAIPYLNNFRIGFSSISGSVETDRIFEDVDSKVKYTADFTGLSFDYAIVPFRHFALLPGVNAGWGSLLYENYNESFMERNEASFWSLKPHLNIEYALAEYLMVRLGAAYTTTFMNDWKKNYNHNDPLITDLDGNGMEISFGIYVGVFTY